MQGQEERAGFVIGKQGSGLPIAVTYEVLDNKDDPPYFEVILYKRHKNKDIACTLTCWGRKDQSDRIQMSATYSRPFPNEKPVFIAENVGVENHMSVFKQFTLPFEVKGKVDMIEYGLSVRRSPSRTNPAGFDLTLFDMVGRFDADVGEW